MLKKYLGKAFLVVGLWFSYSCSAPENQSPKAEVVISVDLQNPVSNNDLKPIDISEIIDSISSIKLEYTPESVISQISEVRLFKERIFILDKAGEKVFVFDKTGNFINAISAKGKGPGEYIGIETFDVHPYLGEIHIFDNVYNRIVVYSSTGQFLRAVELDNIVRDFMVLPSGDYVFYTPDYNIGVQLRGLWQTDAKGHLKEKWFSIPDDFRYGGIYPNYFQRLDEETIGLVGSEYKDRIYHITDRGVSIPYAFEVNIEIPERIEGREVNIGRNVAGKAYTKQGYIETEGRLMILFYDLKKGYVSVNYNKRTQEKAPDVRRYRDMDGEIGPIGSFETTWHNDAIYSLSVSSILSEDKWKENMPFTPAPLIP